MAITVEELISIPYLGTSLRAGAAGKSRSITWAHSCEVPNPWNWLDRGDLLMTNGYSIPVDRDGQVRFLAELANAGISALAIGERQQAPPITDEMVAAADDLQLPLLFTAYEVPFIALARAVADANHREEHARLMRTVRVYDRLRESAVAGADARTVLDRLAEDLRVRIYVVDQQSGRPIFPGAPEPPAALGQALRETLPTPEGPVPALTRVPFEERTALVVPVPCERAVLQIALPLGAQTPDLAILQHVATVVGLQVERQTTEREERRVLGAELLGYLVDGEFEAAAVQDQLYAFGLDTQSLVMVACDQNGGPRADTLHHRLTDRGVPHLLLRRPPVLFAALPDEVEALAQFTEELGDGIRCGLSDQFSASGRAKDAAREAVWAMHGADRGGVPVRYGENSPLFLPRTLGEAEAVARQVLGPLLDYDEEHGTDFVDSLRAFLRCNRSWQRASRELFVHKQTLVYRIRRVEELTGRKLDDTSAVAELWFALKTLDLAESLPPRPNATAGRDRGSARSESAALEAVDHVSRDGEG